MSLTVMPLGTEWLLTREFLAAASDRLVRKYEGGFWLYPDSPHEENWRFEHAHDTDTWAYLVFRRVA